MTTKLYMTNFSPNLEVRLLNHRYYPYKSIADNGYSQVFLGRDIMAHRKCLIKQLCLDICPAQVKLAHSRLNRTEVVAPALEDNNDAGSLVEDTKEFGLRQEAKILRVLSEKSCQISQFYDYFDHQGSLYLVQEWITGITLEQKLDRRTRLSETETKAILLKLLEVVESVHSSGIAYGGLKLENVILRSQDSLPMLVDFSRAQPLGDRCQASRAAYSNDLYSVGLIAIQLLTGRLVQTAPAKNLEISISHNFKKVIDRAISSQLNQRFTSAPEMRSALLSSLSTVSLAKKTAGSTRRSWIVFSILGISIFNVSMRWHIWKQIFYFATELNEKPSRDFGDLFAQDSLLNADNRDVEIKDESIEIDNILRAKIFTVGTSNEPVLQALGKPAWRKPGFGTNSIAWSYKNVVAEGIDLGYIFDVQTNKLRQVEIAVPPTTSFKTLYAALTSLSASEISPSLEQGLKAVYQRRQLIHNFTLKDLEGTIQRNHKDRIYLAVWSANFQ